MSQSSEKSIQSKVIARVESLHARGFDAIIADVTWAFPLENRTTLLVALSRAVNAGKLQRVSPGVYRGNGPVPARRGAACE